MSRRVRETARFVWLNIGIALLVLFLMESAARGVFALRDRARTAAARTEFERHVPFYVGTEEEWVRGLLREQREARQGEWHPYVYWRARPYQGTYLNINKEGIRRTWNSTASLSPGQLKVFTFGGSTMWGAGARDDFTIPSLVSKTLSKRVRAGVWVVNLSESGYVSTQEVIALILELQKGNGPDLAVFYDGVNDTFAAFQSRVAGIPQNEHNRVAEFDALKRFGVRQAIVEKLALYRLIGGGMRSRGIPRTDGLPNDQLARAVVNVYLRNISIVEGLAQRFGFRAVFFWQPTVFTKKQLSPWERQVYQESERRLGAASFYGEVYEAFKERMKTSPADNVHDLSGIFDDVRDTIFSDEFHVSEAGNQKIAESIAGTLQKVTKERTK